MFASLLDTIFTVRTKSGYIRKKTKHLVNLFVSNLKIGNY
nr:MAG TPA: hypothetical protein [Caudoviricetes sp.]